MKLIAKAKESFTNEKNNFIIVSASCWVPVVLAETTTEYASQAQRLQMIRMQHRCKIN